MKARYATSKEFRPIEITLESKEEFQILRAVLANWIKTSPHFSCDFPVGATIDDVMDMLDAFDNLIKEYEI